MDRLWQLVVNFVNLPHGADRREFVFKFVEAMNGMLLLIEEALMDSRDIHDTNQFYAAVYTSVSNLRSILRAYEVYIMTHDSEDEEEA